MLSHGTAEPRLQKLAVQHELDASKRQEVSSNERTASKRFVSSTVGSEATGSRTARWRRSKRKPRKSRSRSAKAHHVALQRHAGLLSRPRRQLACNVLHLGEA